MEVSLLSDELFHARNTATVKANNSNAYLAKMKVLNKRTYVGDKG